MTAIIHEPIIFKEQEHKYFSDGVEVPSVSFIISNILGTDHSFIKEWYAIRGTLVHQAIEMSINGELDEDSLDPELLPYFLQWKAFLKETKFVPKQTEVRRFRSDIWIAGTLDLIGDLAGKKILLDIKTGQKQKWHSLQTAGYAYLNKQPEMQRGCLYLSKTNYKLQPHAHKSDVDMFVAMAKVYNRKGEFK